VSATLPGTIVDSNATRRDGERLVWEFSSDDFLLEPYDIRVRSRLVYPGRIAAAGAAVAVVLALAVGAGVGIGPA
jgi:hypothetical protein